MNATRYYSVRMHASCAGDHISGAERIVTGDRIAETMTLLLDRTKGRTSLPDRTVVTIDDLGPARPQTIPALNLTNVLVDAPAQGRSLAKHVLIHAGIAPQAIEAVMEWLSNGAAPGGKNMRGAMIVDAATGERLEPDQGRGIRASRFDWNAASEICIREKLNAVGLSHHRTREALALASKIAGGPAVAGELCWSDDPDYQAGYAASRATGYVRFPRMKNPGNVHGGRALFLQDRSRLQSLIEYLELRAVLIEPAGSCSEAADLKAVLGANSRR